MLENFTYTDLIMATLVNKASLDAKLGICLNVSASHIIIGDIRGSTNSYIVSFAVKTNFFKWLFFGNDQYQAKFTKDYKLISVIKLKARMFR